MSSRQRAMLLLVVACGACDTDSADVAMTTGHGSWLRYEGTFRYFVEQPEGATDCGRDYYHGHTSGNFGVKPGDEAGALVLNWEGMGCNVSVEGPAAGPFTATNKPCELTEDAGIRHFGVVSIHFDDFAFDPEGSTLTARGRIVRVVDGQRTSYCFELPDVL